MVKKQKKLCGGCGKVVRKLQAEIRFLKTTVNKNTKEVVNMAGSLDEATVAFGELKTVIAEQKDQTAKLITAVDKLVTAVGSNPDFAPLIAEINTAKADLLGDDQSVQDALDKANPPTPPVA